MKLLVGIIMSMIFISNAASIMWYLEKEVGEREIIVLNSEFIRTIYYVEEDKMLKCINRPVQLLVKFKVETLEEAKEIMKKVYDKNNNELIELELY